ncbi:putative heme-binding domain-containing protein [Anseongella ginsenosidimutans]|uniref:Putative heme-binding domain-containing protein n=1 Tax=Anseongella ginsenosidimutans TaxID=496056 RepID=A0A4R3KPN3_9SPHI|nr:HEAT repeat domain-containing protein [Anseongella ginsenosidimutans]TCS86698.1 putative heme-binding domain-containing protein [Anseongella ginsenosidimutans]
MVKLRSKSGILFWLTGLGLLALAGWLWIKQGTPQSSPETEFSLRNGLRLEVIATEPDVINPMTMCVDEEGNIYVTESATYRYGVEGSPSGKADNTIKRIKPGTQGRPEEVEEVKVVASGFENPVMGVYIYENKLYATCLNELFVMDITPTGDLVNRRLLVKDAAEPWNPFGMYRVAVGPDGRLWLAIADHPGTIPVTLTGSDGKTVQLSGQSGGIVSCNLDGSGLEMMVEGFRAPFAFDFDPWGNLWAVSNGEGSPNLYVKVIPGMDYGYQSRDVSYAWLAGKTSLAPPVYEMGAGANTAALHYYSSLFGDSFRGSILMANWGSHGANPGNRSIKQFFLDKDRTSGEEQLETLREAEQPLITSADTMFRPTCLIPAPDGGLYLADWHGVDDESNQTGRIYKIVPENNRPEPGPAMEEIRKMDPESLSGLLSHRNHFTREQAIQRLARSGEAALPALGKVLDSREDPLAAAGAIWALVRINTNSAAQKLKQALQHPDTRIRSLAMRQLRDMKALFLTKNELELLARPLAQSDPSAEVRVEAALSSGSPEAISKGLLSALEIAADRRLRYRIGFELGRNAKIEVLEKLAGSTDPEMQKIAFIAAETAQNEGNALAQAVAGWDMGVVDQNAGETLVRRVLSGSGPLSTSERLTALKWLATQPAGPEEKLIAFLAACLEDPDYPVQMAALEVIRNSKPASPDLGQAVLHAAHEAGSKNLAFLQAEAIYALGSFKKTAESHHWYSWISNASADVVTASLRALRQGIRPPALMDTLWPAAAEAARTHPSLAGDVAFTFRRQAAADEALKNLANRGEDKQQLARDILSSLKEASVQRGKWAFASACIACHTTDTRSDAEKLGPGLASIGASARAEYIVESILEPSKILKTGFQLETLEMQDGRTLSGQVSMKDKKAVISNLGAEQIVDLDDIKTRSTSHLSPMPSGLDNGMTVAELADLTAYLLSLNGTE